MQFLSRSLGGRPFFNQLTFSNIATVELALGFGGEAIIVAATSAVDEGLAVALEGIVGEALHITKAPATDCRLKA